jgi:hypothetical protein
MQEIQAIVLSDKMLEPFVNYFDNSKGYEYLIQQLRIILSYVA